jgi:uncharacterized protein YjbI with pentapeptide repeats
MKQDVKKAQKIGKALSDSKLRNPMGEAGDLAKATKAATDKILGLVGNIEARLKPILETGKKEEEAPDIPEEASLTREDIVKMVDETKSLEGKELIGLDLTGIDFTGVDFSNALCYQTRFAGSQMAQSRFVGANVSECDFSGCNLEQADLSKMMGQKNIFLQAKLDEIVMKKGIQSECQFDRATFISATIQKSDLYKSTFDQCDFSCADLENADFTGCSINSVKFLDCNMKSTRLLDVKGEDVDFTGADLTKLRANFQSTIHGVIAQGVNAMKSLWEGTDLTGADFKNADLQGANFNYTQLINCDFSGANIDSGSFIGANVDQTDLSNVNLFRTNFQRAVIRNSNISNSNLYEADFLFAQTENSFFVNSITTRTLLERK